MTSRYLRILPSILQWVCVVTGTYESRSITILHPILHSTPMNQHVREAAKICRHCENSWCIETIVWWKPASIDWILFILGHGNWWWKYWIDRYSDNLMRCNIEEFSHAWIPLDEKRTWSPNKDICGLERVWIELKKRDRGNFWSGCYRLSLKCKTWGGILCALACHRYEYVAYIGIWNQCKSLGCCYKIKMEYGTCQDGHRMDGTLVLCVIS